MGDDYKLAPYVSFREEDRSKLKELINIYKLSSKDKKDMNKIGNKHNYFSVADLKKKVKNKEY